MKAKRCFDCRMTRGEMSRISDGGAINQYQLPGGSILKVCIKCKRLNYSKPWITPLR